MPTLVFKNDQQLGPFEDADILAALKVGEYSLEDLAWREGMTAWEPLRALYPMSPPPVPRQGPAPPQAVPSDAIPATSKACMSRPISFGAGRKVDGFGFVRKGEIKISSSRVEISGPRHWHPALRIILFLVGWLISTWLFSMIFGGIASALGGAVWNVVALVLGNPITAAAFTLWIVHDFCASAAVVTLEKSQITTVTRVGAKISFEAPAPKSRKPKRAVFRAHNAQAAQEIEQALSS